MGFMYSRLKAGIPFHIIPAIRFIDHVSFTVFYRRQNGTMDRFYAYL
jgi:hypothetical protein